jgi:predicted house-cleaning noncanonical NTP pyrophosphatase (MazG superfamily)
MLEPKDSDLLRNQEFAKELAKFAAENQIVIELAGGVLSHAYHILRREGAQVECIDLFGADEEKVEYNKLVRDKIPDVIARKGENVEVVRLKGEALLAALRQKLIEESFEALDARSGDELVSELADVLEVIAGICEALQIPVDQVEAERTEKRKRRGGFQRGIMLRRTSTPHSLAPEKPTRTIASPLSIEKIDEGAIEHASAIRSNRPYVRPDLRNVDEQQEVLLTFETELNRINSAKHSTLFEMPIAENEVRKLRLFVELTRNRATLWSQVRLRLEPTQIPIRLDQLELFGESSKDDLKG